MKILTIKRRQFLLGAGGFTLALPFLGSLAASPSRAGNAPYAKNPRFVCFTSNHGGIWARNMFPADATLTQGGSVFSDHAYRAGPLVLGNVGAGVGVSPVLSAPASKLTPALAAKMMAVRGLDIPFYINHHTGGYLGNFARTDSEGSLGLEYRPTIDQVMAWSSGFYPEGGATRERSLHVGNGISWGYSNPGSASGSIQAIPGSTSSGDLFRRIFTPSEPTPAPGAQRTAVVDRVYEHYDAVRNGAFGDASRLSSEDRRRLDDHMDRLAELERRVSGGGAAASALCTADLTPARSVGRSHPGVLYETRDVPATIEYYQTYNDVIAAAFICGTSRIATVAIAEHLSSDPRTWHDQIAHRGDISEGQQVPGEELPQTTLADAQQRLFEHVMLDLAMKLDFEESDGVTFLDNSLLMWAQESGTMTHHADSLPLVTLGSAAGYFKAGRYYDYRNLDNPVFATKSGVWGERHPGVLWQQWLANVLMSMNVPREQFERGGLAGYGLHYRGDPGPDAWPDRLFEIASNPLPGMV